MSASFTRLANVTASTKRNPAIGVGGVRGTPVTHIASLKCLPLASVNAEVAARLGIRAPHETKSTAVQSALDIVEGDVLVVAGVEYEVQHVEEYPWASYTDERWKRLVVIELRAQ